MDIYVALRMFNWLAPVIGVGYYWITYLIKGLPMEDINKPRWPSEKKRLLVFVC